MANLPVRGVNRLQIVLRIVLHMFFRICVIMLRLFVNRVTLAVIGALFIAGAIFAALRVAPPAKSMAGEVQQHSLEELTVQFSTSPIPLSMPLLHVSSYDIQWRSIGTGESWTTEGEVTILGVTEGTEGVAYTVKGLDPDRVYRFRLRGRNILGAGPWSDWFPSNGLVPGPGPTATPEPSPTPTPSANAPDRNKRCPFRERTAAKGWPGHHCATLAGNGLLQRSGKLALGALRRRPRRLGRHCRHRDRRFVHLHARQH